MKICAWCKKELAPGSVDGESHRLISHGICAECEAQLFSEERTTAREFLETLHEPVFLVDGDARFIAANRKAREVVGKNASEIDDHLCGEVIECANSFLPGGCGETECCKACTIRQSITHTIVTGRSLRLVPAYQDIKTPDGVQRKRFLISVEKVGGFVLLRIDDAE